MIVNGIEFTSFRNIEKEKFEFSNGVNVIYGENAQGKTNTLEGIYLFARGKSFRATKDKELIKFGENVAYAKLDFTTKNENIQLGVEISKNEPKRFYRNGNRVAKTADIIGDFKSVLFCPTYLGIISDAPSVRRNFLDIAVSQLRPVYIKMLTRYNAVMANRNAVLKLEPVQRKQYGGIMEVYNDELSSLSADISIIRNEYSKKLDFWVKNFVSDMTSEKEISKITYETDIGEAVEGEREEIKRKYLKLLSENSEREEKYGITLYGIHKDDLRIDVNGKDSRLYSSQGQKRSLSLALKLAESEISRENTGEYPVLLLDDVMSELDENRRLYVLSKIDSRQVIITSCEAKEITLDSGANFIRIKNGLRTEE